MLLGALRFCCQRQFQASVSALLGLPPRGSAAHTPESSETHWAPAANGINESTLTLSRDRAKPDSAMHGATSAISNAAGIAGAHVASHGHRAPATQDNSMSMSVPRPTCSRPPAREASTKGSEVSPLDAMRLTARVCTMALRPEAVVVLTT